ncbi:hypothetical protein A8B78_14930 [Jannaschia sp. EhC01]|nr:hypothetical protein A8B78_14930 [Jannaschia sp. EhC01]
MTLTDATANRFEIDSIEASGSVRQSGRSIQSVDRALTILEVIAEERDGLTLSVIAEPVGLNASTCHHLISTLVHRGYVVHISRSQGYALGSKVREINDAADQAMEPSVLLREDVKALGARLGYGIQLAVLSNTSLMTKLSFAGSKFPVEEPDESEKMTALHATATGKSILAWVPDTELVRVISANGLNSYTSKTITSLSGVVEDLRWVRRRKFAVDDEEFREGIVCIGSSIRKTGGEVVAAISVTMPAEQATEENRAKIAREMIIAGNQFSAKLRKGEG